MLIVLLKIIQLLQFVQNRIIVRINYEYFNSTNGIQYQVASNSIQPITGSGFSCRSYLHHYSHARKVPCGKSLIERTLLVAQKGSYPNYYIALKAIRSIEILISESNTYPQRLYNFRCLLPMVTQHQYLFNEHF